MRWLCAFVVLGCANHPCAGFDTCVAIEVRGAMALDQLRVDAPALGVLDRATPPEPRALSLPVQFALLPGDDFAGGELAIALRGLLQSAQVAGADETSRLERGQHARLVVTLRAPDEELAGVDLAAPPPPDLAGADLAGAAPPDLARADLAPKPTGSVCTQPDECRSGDLCSDITDQLRRCLRTCTLASPCPTNSVASPGNVSQCLSVDDGPFVCSIPCNPIPKLGPSGCPSPTVCNLHFVGDQQYTDCTGTLGKAAGQSCQLTADCAEGLFCIGGGVCVVMCRRGHDEDCPSGTVCVLRLPNDPFGACCPGGQCP